MSDGEVAFDNWEEAAEEIQHQMTEAQKQEAASQHKQQEETAGQKGEKKQKKQSVKTTLKQRLQEYKSLSAQDFHAKHAEILESSRNVMKTSLSSIMKDDKDFKVLAATVARRLDKATQEGQPDDNLVLFFQQMMLYLYNGLEHQTLFELKKKIKVLKNTRKEQDKIQKKIKLKEQRQRKNNKKQEPQTSVTLNTKKLNQDSLFEGAADINSKQVDEQRKNKAQTKQQTPKQAAKEQSEDSDDFM